MQKLTTLASTSASLFFLVALLGCGANSAAPTTGAPVSDGGASVDATAGPTPLPCDVDAVLAARCRDCHSSPPRNGAPSALVSWEDLTGPARSDRSRAEYAVVHDRIHDDSAPMPQPPNPRLSAAETATIDGWVAAGAPKGTTSCNPTPVGDAAPPTLDCASSNLTIAPSAPWAMPTTDNDDYVCFGYDAPAGSIPAGTVRHILGMTPNVDNHTIVHHVLLYQADSAFPSVPAKCSAGGSLTWRVVYGWAPGGTAMKTPPDVGFPYDGTTHFVVQVHYNNINHVANQTDRSGFSLCTTDQPVKYDADVMAFGTQSIDVKAHSALDQTCSLTVPAQLGGVHVFAAFPHMHQLGTGIDTKQFMSDGGVVDLGKNDPWNFNNQLWFPISSYVAAGDVIKTRCAWQNNTGADVQFGQNTEQEMCYSFTAYYPRVSSIPGLGWSWAAPALYATCAPTPDGGL